MHGVLNQLTPRSKSEEETERLIDGSVYRAEENKGEEKMRRGGLFDSLLIWLVDKILRL